jgi:hypothetical protein
MEAPEPLPEGAWSERRELVALALSLWGELAARQLWIKLELPRTEEMVRLAREAKPPH